MPRDEGLGRSEPALGVLHAKQKLPVMDTRELRLALKYAYLWKIRTEPLRQKTHCVPTSDRCSVHHVIVRSHDGSYEVCACVSFMRCVHTCGTHSCMD